MFLGNVSPFYWISDTAEFFIIRHRIDSCSLFHDLRIIVGVHASAHTESKSIVCVVVTFFLCVNDFISSICIHRFAILSRSLKMVKMEHDVSICFVKLSNCYRELLGVSMNGVPWILMLRSP